LGWRNHIAIPVAQFEPYSQFHRLPWSPWPTRPALPWNARAGQRLGVLNLFGVILAQHFILFRWITSRHV
jgi:hypothetical protein